MKGRREEGKERKEEGGKTYEVCRVDMMSLFSFASMKCTLEVTHVLRRETGRFLYLV